MSRCAWPICFLTCGQFEHIRLELDCRDSSFAQVATVTLTLTGQTDLVPAFVYPHIRDYVLEYNGVTRFSGRCRQ